MLRIFIRPQAPQTTPFKELTFIIDSDEPNLLQEIHVAEQSYLSAVEALDRANMIRAEFQTKYQPQTIDHATGRAVVEAKPHDVYALKNATDNLYVGVDKALPQFDKQVRKNLRLCKAQLQRKKGDSSYPSR